MLIISLAWNNLWYNFKRTILQIILISITLASLILYKGYVNYTKEGMALGFIEKNGNIQISSSGMNTYLDSAQLQLLYEELKNFSEIEHIEAVLEFSGIIGTENTSSIFWGQAFDTPETRYGVKEGIPVFSGTNDVVLGSGLAKLLNLNLTEESYVNVLSNTNESGIALASFKVSGITDTGIPQNDEGLVIADRAAVIDFLGEEDTASYLQVYLKDDKDTALLKAQLAKNLESDFSIKDWIELNPSYNQVNSMNEMQYAVVSLIMCVLVFVSLTQSLATAFNERLYEFGTLEAIGLKKTVLVPLLITEVLFLSLIGIASGCAVSFLVSNIVSVCKIEFIPPGYSSGYILSFFITARTIIGSALFVLVTCLVAMVAPVSTVVHNSVIKLMYHSE